MKKRIMPLEIVFSIVIIVIIISIIILICLQMKIEMQIINKNSEASLIASNILENMKTRSYDDKDGKKVYVTEVVANSVQFLSTGNTNGSNAGGYNSADVSPFDFGPEPTPSRPTQTVSVEKDPFESFGESATVTISDNDLPF